MDPRALHAEITALLQAGRIADALAALKNAPAGDLNFTVLQGLVALGAGDAATAVTQFKTVLAQRPDWPPVLGNLAQAQLAAGDAGAAQVTAARLCRLARDPAAAILLATAAEAAGDQAAANIAWADALARGSRDPAVTGNLWLGRRKLWDWREPLPTFTEDQLTPAAATVLSADPAFQRRVAERWCTARLPPAAGRPPRAAHDGALRVGYLSSDIHHHATAYLIAELFALHDPARIDAFCFSTGTPDASSIRERIMETAPHFIDLYGQPPAAQLAALRDTHLDILVDLKGHTRGHALPLLAQRPAPIQIHYLGHPGTIGHPAIDYLVGDQVVTPPGCEQDYAEQLIRLPHCYQINDRIRPVADALPRAAYGLPHDKVVLACFNQSYKLTPDIFALWASILQARPDTLLWLYNNIAGAEANLRAHAQTVHGLSPDRIVFAGPLPNDAHLARWQAADLALDTYPYGSHTTGSDALWAGVPLLAYQGETYPSRVSASLLHAVGLPELIKQNDADCRALALALIDDAPRRAQLRQQLQTARATAPLWNTPQWVRDWESALLAL